MLLEYKRSRLTLHTLDITDIILKYYREQEGFIRDVRYYLPTPPLGQDMTQGQFLSGV